MKWEYFVLLLNDICCSLQSFARPSRYEGKFVTAKCSSINGGASAEIFRRHSHEKLIARSISFGIKLPEGSAYGNHYYASGFFLLN